MFCKKCGTKLSKTAQFCHKCGTKTDVPQIKLSKKTMAIVGAIALIFLLTFGIVTLIDNLSDSPSSGGSGGSYNTGGSYNSGSSNTGTSSGLSKSLGLSLSVTSTKKSGNYTYVYCSVKNVSSNYSSPTRYRYVKVKALFKDYSGQVVDTDWTYAVDSVWLEPGETKTFYYMVKNTSVSSATLSFTE